MNPQDLPRSVKEVTVACPNCGAWPLVILERDWPEKSSLLWKTQCALCGHIWDRMRN